MSEKMACPACGAYTSSVLSAYVEGDPCPHCGLSAEAASEVMDARRSAADADLTRRYTEAVVRADKAETRVAELERRLADIRRAAEGTDA